MQEFKAIVIVTALSESAARDLLDHAGARVIRIRSIETGSQDDLDASLETEGTT